MNRKNLATTIILLLSTLVFAVVGSSFMKYVYEDKKIVIENPKIKVAEGILVYSSDDQSKQQIDTLKFSDSELGLKPVTGEENSETKIPSTVTNVHGSEGLYATIKVTSNSKFNIVINNFKIQSDDAEKVKTERENIKIGIMDKSNTKDFVEDEFVLLEENAAVEDKEYTILFWLGGNAGNSLQGSKISFDINFVKKT